MRLQGWEWIIILAIVLLLWGAPKLPALAKSAAQSMRIFRKEIGKNGEATEAKAEEVPAEAPSEATRRRTNALAQKQRAPNEPVLSPKRI